MTVLIAFGANLLVAVAKSVAAGITASASLVAEAAHSWADTGNEIFLLIADRRSRRPPDRAHPLGTGREAYVWSLFAALGLFVAGAAVSITHGIQELIDPEPATDYLVGYPVLAVAFVLEGISFLQSVRQARREAAEVQEDLLDHVLATSDPTLRAVFAEDAAALVGLLIAAAGLGLHQLTGSPVPDAIGSIGVGLVLAVVAAVLINRNRQFLVGQEVTPRMRDAALAALLDLPDVDRVTALRMVFVGPRQIYLIADVDLTGDDTETHLAVRLRALEDRIRRAPSVVECTLTSPRPMSSACDPMASDAAPCSAVRSTRSRVPGAVVPRCRSVLEAERPRELVAAVESDAHGDVGEWEIRAVLPEQSCGLVQSGRPDVGRDGQLLRLEQSMDIPSADPQAGRDDGYVQVGIVQALVHELSHAFPVPGLLAEVVRSPLETRPHDRGQQFAQRPSQMGLETRVQ
nr:cation transporter [Nakamurella leprariae]